MKQFFLVIFIMLPAFSVFSQQSPDCVRALPEPILKKSVFPKKTFMLTEGTTDNPGKIGYEKVKVNKKIDLTIKNWGCEDYTLTFQFLIGNQSQKISNTKFWYDKAIELMSSVKKGIRKQDIDLISRGLKAVSTYKNKSKNPRYENYLEFGGTEIVDSVVLEKVVVQGNKHKVEISFSIGPL